MKKRKYEIGDTFDVWWEVIAISERKSAGKHRHYTLKNKANGMELEITDTTLWNIADGKTTVSNVISYKGGCKNQEHPKSGVRKWLWRK